MIALRSRILPAWFWIVGPAAVALVLAAVTTLQNYTIILPLAAQLAAAGIVVFLLWRRRHGFVPWFEIGVVYATIVALYGVYPLVKFLVVGEHYYMPAMDNRWSTLDPTTAEVARIGWFYAAHLVAFVGVYLMVRGRLPVSSPTVRPASTPSFIAVVSIYVFIQVFWFFLGVFYNTTAATYAETYLISQRLPLVLAQLLNHLDGGKYPLSLIILVGLFGRYPASRRIIIGWIILMAALTVVRFGSRTELVLLIMAAGMTYHAVVRPVSPRAVFLTVAAGLLLFTAFGVLRGASNPDRPFLPNPFLYATEFDILFGNAIELARAAGDPTIVIPPAVYFVDLAALIPQQIAPFEKIEPAAWFASTFYPEYAAGGGGFAFGTMAEAALTGGVASAVCRGAALGFCFAQIHRLYARRSESYWSFVFYLWATTLSYQAFRATTFYLLVLFFFRFIPAMIVVRLISAGLERAARQTRVWLASGTA